MSRNRELSVFVGNLEPRVSEDILYELFLQAGPLEGVYIPKDKSGNQRTFGFVEFSHEVSVGYASALLNGISLYGRPITVKPSEGNGFESPRSSNPGLFAESGQSPQRIMSVMEERGLHRSISSPDTLLHIQWQSGNSPQFMNSPNPFFNHTAVNRMQMTSLPLMQNWNPPKTPQNGQNYGRKPFGR